MNQPLSYKARIKHCLDLIELDDKGEFTAPEMAAFVYSQFPKYDAPSEPKSVAQTYLNELAKEGILTARKVRRRNKVKQTKPNMAKVQAGGYTVINKYKKVEKW